MNIDNFSPMKGLSLEEVFEKQRDIKFLYEPESKKHFDEFDIDALDDQELFKKYTWRIVEELMEAKEEREYINHIHEEVIDAFNFLIELYLLYGWKSSDLPRFNWIIAKTSSQDFFYLEVIYQLGITCNILKNRQWRSSHYLVDLYIFESRFRRLWSKFFDIFSTLGLSPDQVLELWSLKYQVNLFRIQTKY